jgi:hypothetical protein
MAFHYNLNALPKTETEHLHSYITAESDCERTEAATRLFEQVRPMVQYICHKLLWARFKYLEPDVIQEAWESCMGEFLACSQAFLRDERPQFRQFALGVTVRTVGRLQKRAQREQARTTPWENLEGSDRWAYEDAFDTLDIQRIFDRVWLELLESSSVEERQALDHEGSMRFFTGDWASVAPAASGAPRTLTTMVLERRKRARVILDRILKSVHRIESKKRSKLLNELIPLPRPSRPPRRGS